MADEEKSEHEGQVIEPGRAETPSPEPVEQNTPPAETNPPDQTTPDAQAVDEDQEPAEWQFHAEDAPATTTVQEPPHHLAAPVSWTASEYIAHQKNAGWYVLLGLGVSALAIAIYFLTHDNISVVMTVVVGIIFGVFAARQPKEITYALDQNGLQIGQKFYPYGGFKSFSVMQEGAIPSIQLMPMQRFMPAISLYYDPKDEDRILAVLTDYLPHEERQHDMVDRLMRKLRF